MSQVSKIVEEMRAFASLQGMSKTKLAREIGMSPNGLRDLFSSDFNPTKETLHSFEIYKSKVKK